MVKTEQAIRIERARAVEAGNTDLVEKYTTQLKRIYNVHSTVIPVFPSPKILHFELDQKFVSLFNALIVNQGIVVAEGFLYQLYRCSDLYQQVYAEIIPYKTSYNPDYQHRFGALNTTQGETDERDARMYSSGDDLFPHVCDYCGSYIESFEDSIRCPLMTGAWDGWYCSVDCLTNTVAPSSRVFLNTAIRFARPDLFTG